ncbi:MAG: LPXTG cell wall anchor domain-containing protein, partial [Lachnospiraceae bacterium]|nr:LPXTG cell wall anchor domain-containing protein [Lachnospiraceae bacterium]
TIESEDNPLNNIPVDVINNITGEKSTIEVNLAYSGEFGFTAVLTTNLSSANAGYYANLFYYNPTTKELEYVCADVIADDGTAELTFTHASDYVIVIDDVDLGMKAPAIDNGPGTGDKGVLYLLSLMLLAMLGMTGIIYLKKKNYIE